MNDGLETARPAESQHHRFGRECVLMCCMVFAAAAASGQGNEKPKDIDGWGKIKWGMTLDQARAAYEVTTPLEVNDYWTHLILSPVKVGDIEMRADAQAKHGSDRISGVRLSRYWSDKDFSSHDFDTVKALLVAKYGLPTSEEKKMEGYDRPVTSAVWIFPSTSIVLQLTPAILSVQYTALDKKALDVL